MHQLKGLQDIISFTAVDYLWPMETSNTPYNGSMMSSSLCLANACLGWRFVTEAKSEPEDNVVPDPLHDNIQEVRQLYFKADKNYDGRYTVPILWDKKSETIVNNESSEIIRMFNVAFNSVIPEEYRSLDFYPDALRRDIDSANDWIYNNVNNGV